ncbi:PIN domain protein [uncultured archaeon]|nr:PIN domain protein [uncultured archaeon]
MNRILIDTMHIADLLIEDSHFELARKLQNKKITGLVSVITLTELVKTSGMKNEDLMYSILDRLISSNLVFVDVSQKIAIRAGELRLKYDIPTADSLIAATGIVENVKHILTDDDHFDPLVNLIKPINLKTAVNMFR